MQETIRIGSWWFGYETIVVLGFPMTMVPDQALRCRPPTGMVSLGTFSFLDPDWGCPALGLLRQYHQYSVSSSELLHSANQAGQLLARGPKPSAYSFCVTGCPLSIFQIRHIFVHVVKLCAVDVYARTIILARTTV